MIGDRVAADATLGSLSGLVVAANRFDATELWNYAAEANTWAPIHVVNGAARGWPLAYVLSADRIVAYGTQTWLFDIRTGVWSQAGADTPPVDYGMSSRSIVYDEAAQRTLVIGMGAVAYDASADRWESVPMGEGESLWPYSMVYDSVNRRLVGLGRWGVGLDPGAVVHEGGVAAFDLVTREWTVLDKGQAADPRAPLP